MKLAAMGGAVQEAGKIKERIEFKKAGDGGRGTGRGAVGIRCQPSAAGDPYRGAAIICPPVSVNVATSLPAPPSLS